MAHMLVVTTTMRVLHRVHRRAADLWPRIALHTVLVEIIACLEHRLVHTPTACNDAHNSTACRGDCLTRARGQTNPGLLSIIGVAHNHARGAGGT